MVLASSQADQVSWESRHYSNGVFTRRLIEGLRRNGPGTTIGDAFAYMREKIEEEVLRDRAEVQTPVMITHLWKGKELVLQTKPLTPRRGLDAPAAATVGEPRLPLRQAATRSPSSKEIKANDHNVQPTTRGKNRGSH